MNVCEGKADFAVKQLYLCPGSGLGFDSGQARRFEDLAVRAAPMDKDWLASKFGAACLLGGGNIARKARALVIEGETSAEVREFTMMCSPCPTQFHLKRKY